MPSGIGEGKVSEKWVRETEFWALVFSRSRRKGSALKNLPGAVHNGGRMYAFGRSRSQNGNPR